MPSDFQLFTLLRFYGHIRIMIFTLLLPSDVISVCNATRFILNDVEKLRYTNPLLELFYDLNWMDGDNNFTKCEVALTGDDLFTMTDSTRKVKNICMATVRQCKGNCSVKHTIRRSDHGWERPNVYIRDRITFSDELHNIYSGINVYITSIILCNYDNKDSHIHNINYTVPLVCSEAAKFSTVPSINEVEFHQGFHPRTRRLFYIPTYLSTHSRPTIKMSRLSVVLSDSPGFEFITRSIEVVSVDPYSPLAPALLGKQLNSTSIHSSDII